MLMRASEPNNWFIFFTKFKKKRKGVYNWWCEPPGYSIEAWVSFVKNHIVLNAIRDKICESSNQTCDICLRTKKKIGKNFLLCFVWLKEWIWVDLRRKFGCLDEEMDSERKKSL